MIIIFIWFQKNNTVWFPVMRNKVQTQANTSTGNDLVYQLTILRRAFQALGRPTVVNRRLFEGTALSWDTLKVADWCQLSFIILWIMHSHYNVIQCIHFPRYWPFVRGTNGDRWFPLMFYLICAWINGWASNRDAGDLRRHCLHHDVTVMHIDCLHVSVFPLTVTIFDV